MRSARPRISSSGSVHRAMSGDRAVQGPTRPPLSFWEQRRGRAERCCITQGALVVLASMQLHKEVQQKC